MSAGLKIVRWSARGLSILLALVLLPLAIAGPLSHLGSLTGRELAMLLCFPIGLCLGMALAWKWEFFDGLVTVASLVGFYLADYIAVGSFRLGFFVLIFFLPGFLFLGTGWVARLKANSP